jgi:hypothetical protein
VCMQESETEIAASRASTGVWIRSRSVDLQKTDHHLWGPVLQSLKIHSLVVLPQTGILRDYPTDNDDADSEAHITHHPRLSE